MVLSRRRCPYTGVVNFFSDTEPFLAVGSVTKAGAPEVYHWRCYTEDRASGVARDQKTAEHRLSSYYRQRNEEAVDAAA